VFFQVNFISFQYIIVIIFQEVGVYRIVDPEKNNSKPFESLTLVLMACYRWAVRRRKYDHDEIIEI
jgi:hypothetical protein